MRSWCTALVLILLAPSTTWADTPTPRGVQVPSPTSTQRDVTAPIADPAMHPGVPSEVALVEIAAPAIGEEARARLAEMTLRMHEELEALRTRTQERTQELEISLQKAAPGGVATRWELDREIESVKLEQSVESLRIQARYAREVGADAVAAEIDAAVERMMNPRIDTTTVDRTPRPRERAQQR